jgi:hypothetical protein
MKMEKDYAIHEQLTVIVVHLVLSRHRREQIPPVCDISFWMMLLAFQNGMNLKAFERRMVSL